MIKEKIHVLLIEDDEDDYILIKKTLTKITQTEYILTWEKDCNKALSIISQHKHDVYLLDYRLGARTGIEIIEEAHKTYNKKPFILLTSAGTEELGLRALRIGAEDYLAKGEITPAILERAIRYAIERRDAAIRQQELMAEQVTRIQLERQKDEFIGVATHELKTPVTTLKGYTQLLLNRMKKTQDDQYLVHLEKMDIQLNRLNNLISDLLDVTKIQAGKLQLVPKQFRFDELVEEVVESLQHTTDKHTLKIESSLKKNVFGDPDRIAQVITNLLSNAIKYSPNADKIFITSSNSHNSVTFSVQDFGVGIAKNRQKKIFERFYRETGPKEITFPGLGLGLYISSEIIKRHKGKIWVESTKGKGSTFYFTIPNIQYGKS